MPTPTTPDQAKQFATRHDALLANMSQVIRGKDEALRLVLTCLFAEGHLLIEDVPGVGKTSIAKALAHSLGLSWHRIQFTPDLLPSDLTGVTIWNQHSNTFEFRKGAVFANIVLGDEINRASPKTQSALLEVMEEQHVTIDSVSHPVPRPFVVLATQNPIDLDGTYRLPEAQLDRFMIKASVGYPDEEAEALILADRAGMVDPNDLQEVMEPCEVEQMIGLARTTYVAPVLHRYIVHLVNATRTMPELRLGASPRGSLSLLRSAQARAVGTGRAFVTPEDIKALVVPVLAHRMILTPEAELAGHSATELLHAVLHAVPVPQAGS